MMSDEEQNAIFFEGRPKNIHFPFLSPILTSRRYANRIVLSVSEHVKIKLLESSDLYLNPMAVSLSNFNSCIQIHI